MRQRIPCNWNISRQPPVIEEGGENLHDYTKNMSIYLPTSYTKGVRRKETSVHSRSRFIIDKMSTKEKPPNSESQLLKATSSDKTRQTA